MKQLFGASKTGNLKEAVQSIVNPDVLLLMSNAEQFDAHVAELEQLYPGVPSIGCIGMSYDRHIIEKGVGVVAFAGVKAAANVLEKVSIMPARHIERLVQDLRKVNAEAKDTVCIDFCAGNDACVLTTMYSVLGKRSIQLAGGTGDGGKVSANGRVYEDGAAYVLIKNNGARVKAYKENMYRPLDDYRLIASKTDRNKYIIGELNGRPASQVYQELLHIKESDITTQTFKNPFGKLCGQDVCIISIKEVVGNSLACFRQVNDSDVLTLLELKDYRKIVEETIEKIRRDFPRVSGIFSINCLFRYLLFSENHNMQEYLDSMSVLGSHAGLIGYGEHYNNQFVNQSMTCVVFE